MFVGVGTWPVVGFKSCLSYERHETADEESKRAGTGNHRDEGGTTSLNPKTLSVVRFSCPELQPTKDSYSKSFEFLIAPRDNFLNKATVRKQRRSSNSLNITDDTVGFFSKSDT